MPKIAVSDEEEPRFDRRVLACDELHLVLEVQAPEERPRIIYFGAMAAIAAITVLAAYLFFRPYLRPTGAVILFMAVFISAAAAGLTKTVVVGNAKTNELFFERTSYLTRRRTREAIARLTDIQSYAVRGFVDTDTDILPHAFYELSISVPRSVPIWYTGSKATARQVGEELMRLAALART